MSLKLKTNYEFVIVFFGLDLRQFIRVTGFVVDGDGLEKVKRFARFGNALYKKCILFENEIDVSIQRERWDFQLKFGRKTREHVI